MLTSEDETEFHALRKCAAIAILQLVDLILHYYVSETSRIVTSSQGIKLGLL